MSFFIFAIDDGMKLMSNDRKKCLLRNKVDICNSISPPKFTVLLNKLLAEGILVPIEVDYINEQHRMQYDKIGQLVTDLHRGPNRYFDVFCSILTDDDIKLGHISEILQKGVQSPYAW